MPNSTIIKPRDFSEIKSDLWMPIAKAEIGIKESAGHIHSPKIVEYHSKTSGKFTNDETPWCSAFANWVMDQAGFKGTGDARARSWLSWGDKLPAPRFGCLVILSRGNDPNSGHVGFYTKELPLLIEVLGGNQGDQVKLSWFKKFNVLGYRWPLMSDLKETPDRQG